MTTENGGPKGLVLPPGLVLPKRKMDLTLPPRTVYSMTPEQLMLAAARMQRDGMTRDQIMERLEVGLHTGITHAVMDRFLERARALLEQRIAEGKEPAESVVEVPVIDGDPAEVAFEMADDEAIE